mgnify:CR=1
MKVTVRVELTRRSVEQEWCVRLVSFAMEALSVSSGLENGQRRKREEVWCHRQQTGYQAPNNPSKTRPRLL